MLTEPRTKATDHSEPVVFPPIIPLSAFVIGILLDLAWPLGRSLDPPLRAGLRVAGAIVLGVGLGGFGWMVATMKRARTPIHNARTPTALVESGPFRFTRNPMYLFGSIVYAGVALLTSEFWSLALLPLVLVATHYGVVLREQSYLARKFGDAYMDYRRRVRRWI